MDSTSIYFNTLNSEGGGRRGCSQTETASCILLDEWKSYSAAPFQGCKG